MRKVFTFWEPKEKVPGYIRLCMKTWPKCLDGYETVVLDYGNLREYLTDREIDEVLCRKMPLFHQSDCIRCAVLKKHGGTWLDADTILTKPLGDRFSVADCSIVAWRMDGRLVHYAAYINAVKPECRFIADWHRELLPRVAKAKRFYASRLLRILRHGEWKFIRRWNYCENAIIDPMAETADPKDYGWIDKNEIAAVPEEVLMASGLSATEAYQRYWFRPGDPAEALSRCAGVLMLHNSFTPAEFRAMSEEEFLATDTRLARLLKEML